MQSGKRCPRRRPTTTIRDPRNTFAGLVIDPVRNEVVIAEENNFSLLVYDRLKNTPPTAALSEPKRMIQGENTFLEYACGVYVDPATGDIYGINNDTLNWMTVFDRNAKGNASPNRKLATPLSSFAIVADEETQELLMTIQDDHAVVTFKKIGEGPGRSGAAAPGTEDPDGRSARHRARPEGGPDLRHQLGHPQFRSMEPPRGGRWAKPNWPIGRR